MHNPTRIAARAAAVLVSLSLVAGVAGQASADTPAAWGNSPQVSGLHMLLIFVGIPLLLFLCIGTFGWLTHTGKASSYPIRRETDRGVALSGRPADGVASIDGTSSERAELPEN